MQRPASVVKELIENSLDAKATHISIIVKDAGKAFIQVVDNGEGMSELDASLAFRRHATSKIHSASDLGRNSDTWFPWRGARIDGGSGASGTENSLRIG